jgi:hypothetical protein
LLAWFPFSQKKLVAREQGSCAPKASPQLLRISDYGFRIFLFSFFNPHSAIYNPQFGGGRIGRPAGRPYIRITRLSAKEWFARPAEKMNPASWFLRATSLLPGLATPDIQYLFRLFGKKRANAKKSLLHPA